MKTPLTPLISVALLLATSVFPLACTKQTPTKQDKIPPTAEPPQAAVPADTHAQPIQKVSFVPPQSVETGDRTAPAKTQCKDALYSDKFTPGYTPAPEVTQKVEAMLKTLSLKEKADLMRGTFKGISQEKRNWEDIFRSPDNKEKKIRGFMFRDGPRGLNLDAGCPKGENCYSTAFPVEIARGATFDTDLEYRIGVAVGDETVASGNTMMLAPSINIVRHPAWGRTQESYGEDSFLLGKLGSAYIVGVQEYIPACSKHYVANNVEKERRKSNAKLDEQTLREVYGTAYEMTIKEGGVACIMSSYNKVNGSDPGHNRHVYTDILRDDYGFEGFVISDWWALGNDHDVNREPELYATAGKKAVLAGVDMEMPWSLNYEPLESLVQKGEIQESVINRSAARILEQKYRFNIVDPEGPIGLKKPKTSLGDKRSIGGNEAHLDLAYEAALKSAVLLKNDDNTLPIDAEKTKTVAVLGADIPYEQLKWASKPSGRIDFAKDVTIGDLGSSRVNVDPAKSIGPFDGIKNAAGEGIKVITGDSAKIAKKADFIVVVAGLTPGDEGEEYTGGSDRAEFGIDAKIKGTPQNDLIKAAAKLKKPMVVVLVGGSVIDMPWLDDVPAVVMSWYPGIHGGRALGALLFGQKSFSGKLPLTWPNNWDELPEFDPGVPNDIIMDYYLGYRYYDKNDKTPLFPFGHGLSYTKFAYNNLQVPCGTITKNGVAEVKVDVINEGSTAAEEVVMLFASYPDTKGRRSIKELKGFQRVALEPGQAKQVTLALPVPSLKYWNTAQNAWEIELGKVKIMVGGSSSNLPLSDMITVE